MTPEEPSSTTNHTITLRGLSHQAHHQPDGRFCTHCGAKLTESAPAERRCWVSAWSRPRRRSVVVAGAVALVLVVGSIVALGMRVSKPDLSGPVKALFTALANYDGKGVRTYGGCLTPCVAGQGSDRTDGSTDGLATGYTPPTDVTVTGTELAKDGRWAVVGVSYQVAGTAYHDVVGLRPRPTNADEWMIASPPGAFVTVVSQQTTSRIGFFALHPVKAADSETTVSIGIGAPTSVAAAGTIWAPPGKYEVSTERDFLHAATRLSITIGGSTGAAPVLRRLADRKVIERSHRYATLPTIDEASVYDDINARVKQFIDRCASSPNVTRVTVKLAGGMIADCPFGDRDGIHDDNASCVRCSWNTHWQITAYPQVKLEPREYAGVDGPVDVSAAVPGTVTLTFDWADEASLLDRPIRWTRVQHQYEFSVGGVAYRRAGEIRYCQSTAGMPYLDQTLSYNDIAGGCV